MPCMKCANGKWKYGQHGSCVFDTLEACKRAAAAIHIEDDMPLVTPPDCIGEDVHPMLKDQYK